MDLEAWTPAWREGEEKQDHVIASAGVSVVFQVDKQDLTRYLRKTNKARTDRFWEWKLRYAACSGRPVRVAQSLYPWPPTLQYIVVGINIIENRVKSTA